MSRIFLTQAEAGQVAEALGSVTCARVTEIEALRTAIREAASKLGEIENEGRVRAVSVTFWIDEGLPHAGAEVDCFTCNPEKGGQCTRWSTPVRS